MTSHSIVRIYYFRIREGMPIKYTNTNADCNGDGKVAINDLMILKTQFLRNDCPECH